MDLSNISWNISDIRILDIAQDIKEIYLKNKTLTTKEIYEIMVNDPDGKYPDFEINYVLRRMDNPNDKIV